MILLRSLLFNLVFFTSTAALAVAMLPLLLTPPLWALYVMRFWAWLVEAELRVICDIRVKITGQEHLPTGGAALIAAKHQSAFDTIIWLGMLPGTTYVLKRELLQIPIYGRLAMRAGMIAVDRSAGASAMRHLRKSGQAAAAAGRQLVIFPEGTRVAPGVHAPYQPGVAALAAATGLPVIPVATNSGLLWGRRSFLKRPGTITVAVLPPLPAGMKRDALMPALEAVIEAETDRLMGRAGVDKSVDDRPAAWVA